MKLMKRTIYLLACLLIAGTAATQSLLTPEQLAKREKRKNLTVKEWNTDAKTKARWLDHLKVYDSQGRCIEEIGSYEPQANPAEIKVDAEKAQAWIKNGAQPTDTVRGLLKKAGVL